MICVCMVQILLMVCLREKTDMLPSLRCHLFGHQHEANAMIAYNGIIFSNAAVLDNHYNLIANSRVIEL